MDRFIAAWWQSTLTTWPARCEPREILELIDGYGQRVAPYLAAWSTGNSAPAHHLAGLVPTSLSAAMWIPRSGTTSMPGCAARLRRRS